MTPEPGVIVTHSALRPAISEVELFPTPLDLAAPVIAALAAVSVAVAVAIAARAASIPPGYSLQLGSLCRFEHCVAVVPLTMISESALTNADLSGPSCAIVNASPVVPFSSVLEYVTLRVAFRLCSNSLPNESLLSLDESLLLSLLPPQARARLHSMPVPPRSCAFRVPPGLVSDG
jgi:hypothetical protein